MQSVCHFCPPYLGECNIIESVYEPRMVRLFLKPCQNSLVPLSVHSLSELVCSTPVNHANDDQDTQEKNERSRCKVK